MRTIQSLSRKAQAIPTYTQPQVSIHPAFLNNAKFNSMYCVYYISATLLSLSLVCNMTDQPTYTSGGVPAEPFQDAEVFAKAHAAFTEGKQLQADWDATVRTNSYVWFAMRGISYAVPAFSTFAGVMPAKSGKILLGFDDGSSPAGWLQDRRGYEAVSNAGYCQHTGVLVMNDPTAPAILQQVANRLFQWSAKVRTTPGFIDPSIEAVLRQRAGV